MTNITYSLLRRWPIWSWKIGNRWSGISTSSMGTEQPRSRHHTRPTACPPCVARLLCMGSCTKAAPLAVWGGGGGGGGAPFWGRCQQTGCSPCCQVAYRTTCRLSCCVTSAQHLLILMLCSGGRWSRGSGDGLGAGWLAHGNASGLLCLQPVDVVSS